jgi:hypothetical protein
MHITNDVNLHLRACVRVSVQVNKPNLLLFVGEALVGHDGVDQLNM